MDPLEQIVDQVIDKLPELDKLSQEQITENIGAALIIQNVALNGQLLTFDLKNSQPDALKEGENFTGRFLEELRNEICNNEIIQGFILNDKEIVTEGKKGKKTFKLKALLKETTTKVVAALGISGGNVGVAVAVWLVLLLLKVGYKAYCQPVWENQQE